ncbi:MAG: dienelactone hydrolase family protein [Chloroflexi bacterium]|nr:dienelactone hydrolase family protein [Chloroflexota bacterium]
MADTVTVAMVEFKANGGTAQGYLAWPNRRGPAPGIVLIQEWWGLDDHIKDVARRFAAQGYAVLAPDLYHGQVTTEPSEAMKLTQSMDRDRAMKELKGAVLFLKEQPFSTGKVGTIGYCMGGGLSLAAACANREVDACVVYYGGSPSPIDQVRNLNGPFLGIYAERDTRITGAVPALREALAQAGKTFETHVYQGADHAFFNDTRSEIYNPAASQDAWQKTLAFFATNLK